MNDPRFEKLPKWAQEHIKDIERQRDVAIRTLNKALDQQTPSEFFVEGRVCTGWQPGPTKKRVYIQTHTMTVQYKGVQLEIYLRRDEPGMDLQWSEINPEGDYRGGDVAMIPTSRQQARLVSKENMR